MTSTATLATPTPPVTPAPTVWTARLWGTLIVLCGVLFLDGLDVSMVGVALPSISAELDMSPSALQWIVSGYVLGYGGLLLLGGRMADLLGRRKVLLTALAIFAVASLLGGLVDDPALLIGSRFVKGVAAAFTAPAGLSIITTTFPEGPARNRALSIYTACGASGFSSGLILGGLMTEVGWRWTFLLPVPVALAVLAFGVKLIPADAKEKARGGYDVFGAITSTLALLTLVYVVVSAPEAGWTSAQTLGGFAVSALLIGAFLAIESKVKHPLLRLGIFRNRNVVAANLAALAVLGSYVGFQFIVALYMQSMLGWSPLGMAMALLPAGLIVAFGGPRAGALVNRFGAGKVVTAGLIAFVIGYALFLRIDSDPSYLVVMLPTMILIGLGFALAFPALNIQATNGVADHEQGLASGLVQTSFQVGGAIALAVVTAVITSGGSTQAADVLGDYRTALGVVTLIAAIGMLTPLVTLRRK
ncbi:MFS transporter [Longispora albida]|uniref:MFS transporter n=1 Tax=Longispora albida TaxID=203523 RepID=UPI000361AC7D|nr:MFS transporter [Longispora albida]